jgi:GDP-4-dehydro-6-deoxy-D-mannose reductase
VARVLITGASGFAGRHLAAACAAAGDDVHAAARSTGVDLRDPEAARAAVAAAGPEVVYHLAAHAHVGASWADPAATLQENFAMAVNVLEAVRADAADAVVLAVGSGEAYGEPAELPLTEDAPLRPRSPYAASKAAADVLAGFYADAYGLRVVRPRAFNHAGPGQEPRYAISAFARQLAEGLEAGADPVAIVTGSPDARRDYTDVRDVVRAYRLLADARRPGPYNVCSGRALSARELVAALGEAVGVEVRHEVDPARVRAVEVPDMRGSPARLRALTGWEPEIPLARTLADTVAWWRAQLHSAAPPE